MPAPTLEQTQRLLWALITAPEGAAAGLAALPPAERAVAASLLLGNQRLPAVERLDIYADMYFYRIRDCLKEDFPVLCAVVGDTNFHNLITDYLVAHPPSHFSLRYAGQHLPSFVRAQALSTRWPYLSDLARLEWAILDAFDAPDAPPLAAGALTALPAERWPAMRLTLTPSLRLLHCDWNVHSIWRRVQDGTALGEPCRAATALRVWRKDLRVFHHAIDAVESEALAAVAGGACFADVCERIVALGGESGSAERAVRLLGEWLADGLLIGYRLD